MQICLIRHGQTPGNAAHKYVGRTDEPLSEDGVAAALAVGASPSVSDVYVSSLLRTRQTAQLLFPNAAIHSVPGLREMDFGDFEYLSPDEMENNAAYRAWVDAECIPHCPNGESMEEFCTRVCSAFAETVLHLKNSGADRGVFVLHGGSVMAIMERFAVPARGFYDSLLKNCEGFICTLSQGSESVPFTLSDTAAWSPACM